MDPSNVNEMDQKRLQKESQVALEQLLLRSVATNAQAHYKWCIAAVKNLELGRQLDDPELSAEE